MHKTLLLYSFILSCKVHSVHDMRKSLLYTEFVKLKMRKEKAHGGYF